MLVFLKLELKLTATGAKFIKYICRSLFINKVAGLRPTTLLQRGFDKGVIEHLR